MDIKDIPVGANVGYAHPKYPSGLTGRVVAVNDPLVALFVSDRTHVTFFNDEADRRNKMVWPGCPEGVLLLHHTFVKEVLL